MKTLDKIFKHFGYVRIQNPPGYVMMERKTYEDLLWASDRWEQVKNDNLPIEVQGAAVYKAEQEIAKLKDRLLDVQFSLTVNASFVKRIAEQTCCVPLTMVDDIITCIQCESNIKSARRITGL